MRFLAKLSASLLRTQLTPSEKKHIKILTLLDEFFDMSKVDRDKNREVVLRRVNNYLKRASKDNATEVRQEMTRRISL